MVNWYVTTLLQCNYLSKSKSNQNNNNNNHILSTTNHRRMFTVNNFQIDRSLRLTYVVSTYILCVIVSVRRLSNSIYM